MVRLKFLKQPSGPGCTTPHPNPLFRPNVVGLGSGLGLSHLEELEVVERRTLLVTQSQQGPGRCHPHKRKTRTGTQDGAGSGDREGCVENGETVVASYRPSLGARMGRHPGDSLLGWGLGSGLGGAKAV